jgi:hypothetical protein
MMTTEQSFDVARKLVFQIWDRDLRQVLKVQDAVMAEFRCTGVFQNTFEKDGAFQDQLTELYSTEIYMHKL